MIFWNKRWISAHPELVSEHAGATVSVNACVSPCICEWVNVCESIVYMFVRVCASECVFERIYIWVKSELAIQMRRYRLKSAPYAKTLKKKQCCEHTRVVCACKSMHMCVSACVCVYVCERVCKWVNVCKYVHVSASVLQSIDWRKHPNRRKLKKSRAANVHGQL